MVAEPHRPLQTSPQPTPGHVTCPSSLPAQPTEFFLKAARWLPFSRRNSLRQAFGNTLPPRLPSSSHPLSRCGEPSLLKPLSRIVDFVEPSPETDSSRLAAPALLVYLVRTSHPRHYYGRGSSAVRPDLQAGACWRRWYWQGRRFCPRTARVLLSYRFASRPGAPAGEACKDFVTDCGCSTRPPLSSAT